MGSVLADEAASRAHASNHVIVAIADEEQIGATYDELEWAMKNINKQELSQKEEKIMNIFKKFNLANKHKMIPIPVCKIPKKLRS